MKPLTLEETGIKTDDNEMCIKGIDELPIFSWNTKTKEFYVLGHKFDGINSVEDFINYIHNLDKENKSLQSQLKSKEEENQELKLELSGYRQAILEDKEMLGLKEENDKLKKQLEYLRSGEYYNQLRFERDMLQYVADNGKVSKEDKEFIDMTHRNTELLEVIEEVREYIEDWLFDAGGNGASMTYEDINELLQILDKVKN